MKILYVTKFTTDTLEKPRIGTEFFIRNHLKSLSKFSEVEILTFDLCNNQLPGFFSALTHSCFKMFSAGNNSVSPSSEKISNFWMGASVFRSIALPFSRCDIWLNKWISDKLAESKPDLVICGDISNAFVFQPICKKKRIPMVFCEQNLEWMFVQYFFKNVILSKLLERLELKLLRCSDGIFFVSEDDMQTAIKKGVPPDKLYFLPITNLDAVLPGEMRTSIRKKLGVTDKTVVSFIGNRFKPNTETVNWIINELLDKVGNNVHFLILGSVCEDFKAKKLPQNISLMGFVENPVQYIGSSDLFIAPKFEMDSGAGAPSKYAITISLGVPIITNTIGAKGQNFINGTNCIIEDDLSKYSMLIQNLASDKIKMKNISENVLNLQKDNLRLNYDEQFKFLKGLL